MRIILMERHNNAKEYTRRRTKRQIFLPLSLEMGAIVLQRSAPVQAEGCDAPFLPASFLCSITHLIC